jgi:hypothetical protein
VASSAPVTKTPAAASTSSFTNVVLLLKGIFDASSPFYSTVVDAVINVDFSNQPFKKINYRRKRFN